MINGTQAMHPDAPLISVIIPHFNQPEQLIRCLASIADQRFAPDQVEVIVVDNGSRQPLDSVALTATIPGLRILSEPTPGPGPARNTGAAAAHAQILAFIDADCRADSNWLAAISDALPEDAQPQVIGGDVRIDFGDPGHLTGIEAYEAVFAYRQKLYIQQHGYSGTGNLAMHRSVLAAVGSFAGIGIAEDADWGNRAKSAGYPATFIPEMIVFHPARKTFGELASKWSRHIEHGREAASGSIFGSIKWIARALAVLGSTLPHFGKMAISDRLSGGGNRLRGMGILARIRWFRFRMMLAALWRGASDQGDWSRS